MLLYWVTRVWLLAQRVELNEDPVLYAVRPAEPGSRGNRASFSSSSRGSERDARQARASSARQSHFRPLRLAATARSLYAHGPAVHRGMIPSALHLPVRPPHRAWSRRGRRCSIWAAVAGCSSACSPPPDASFAGSASTFPRRPFRPPGRWLDNSPKPTSPPTSGSSASARRRLARDGSYDVVSLIDVLHHIPALPPQPRAVSAGRRRPSAPAGSCCSRISAPNRSAACQHEPAARPDRQPRMDPPRSPPTPSRPGVGRAVFSSSTASRINRLWYGYDLLLFRRWIRVARNRERDPPERRIRPPYCTSVG